MTESKIERFIVRRLRKIILDTCQTQQSDQTFSISEEKNIKVLPTSVVDKWAKKIPLRQKDDYV